MLALAFAVTWLVIGAVAAVVMRRRGHDTFAWAVLFLLLGPLALPLAVSADRHRPPETLGEVHEGELDVLAAHDGSSAASFAVDAALEMLSRQMTSLTLAAVVDIEAATTVRGRDTEREVRDRLDATAGELAPLPCGPVETVVLHGDPAHALARFADEHGFELIVVGASGPGGSRVLRGSVARRLAAGTSVPVLVGPIRR